MDSLTLTFVLLVVYQGKHFLADFPLQTFWMLGKFKAKGWVAPLAAHAGVHACFTSLIAGVVLYLGHAKCSYLVPVYLAAFDFVAHFAMDRVKASPKLLGRFKSLCYHDFVNKPSMTKTRWEGKLTSNRYFWWSLGVDQAWHHCTHYYIIWRLVHYV